MSANIILVLVYFSLNLGQLRCEESYFDTPPEGFQAFVESFYAIPPKVHLPPYNHVNLNCHSKSNSHNYDSKNTLCGDLNKGQIPNNPLKQQVLGEPYPFELIRNHTLKFLSKTLPILKSDDTLPRVTKVIPQFVDDTKNYRLKKQIYTKGSTSNGCDDGGIFCSLYRVFHGDNYSNAMIERREEFVKYEGPPTPCPAKIEYITPVFAKNYQGNWRYIVQIPYEGYFTQTVEVTRCLQSRCHYLDGGCLSSPRWVSLLAAEIYYINLVKVVTSTSTPSLSTQDYQSYQPFSHKYEGTINKHDKANSKSDNNVENEANCDGRDELGCFQVRLYYDWFLIPGSCKCWRPDYFAKYVKRKPTNITAADL